MTELKEGIKPPKPKQKKQHTEAEISILEIRDADGTSLLSKEFDPRLFAVKDGKKCKIKFELKNQPAIVSITITPKAANTWGKKYYGETEVWTDFNSYAAGQHTVEWDGRAQNDGQRLILAGDYFVTVWCACICGNEYIDVKEIKVKKPYADTYGALFPGTEGDKRPPADWARNALKSLSDGSAFECGGSATATARPALARMQFYSAVWFWSGHSGEGRVVFVDAALGKSRVCSNPAAVAGFNDASGKPQPFAAVSELPDGALNDVFLVVLRGCQTAKFKSGVPSLPGALVGKGADLVVSFQEKLPSSSAMKWTQDFWGELKAGKTVREAAKKAKDSAAAAHQPKLTAQITAGGGANGGNTLTPARYGRKKS